MNTSIVRTVMDNIATNPMRVHHSLGSGHHRFILLRTQVYDLREKNLRGRYTADKLIASAWISLLCLVAGMSD